ncbi:hypothetical protein L596_019064 [Steinernema carpocapsae]|uniref:Uncharacterized protein n=1 Tax=Steinernema carpocapsae TaxID=34508 RepID=A0A4U5N7F3_STECR|nr:hypothetical protein L596_019064 [Steinernema carpocapsae]
MLYALRRAVVCPRYRKLCVATTSAIGLATTCHARLHQSIKCEASTVIKSRNPWLISTSEVEAELKRSQKAQSGGILVKTARGILWKVRLLIRFLALSFRVIPLLVAYPPSLLHESLNELWWRWLLHSIRRGGPSLLKLCQWASTRRISSPNSSVIS